MLAEMSSQQFAEWMAYAAVEPFGEEREDYRLAYGLAIIVNLFRGKNDKPVRPIDLLPKVGVLADDGDAVDQTTGEPLPPVHPNVQRFEEMMEQLQWAQSQT